MISIGVTILYSCSKEINKNVATQVEQNKVISVEELESIISDLNSLEKAPPKWWEKVKKWFKDHTGTYLFDNCSYNNPCGPCPGLCLRANLVGGEENDSDTLGSEDYANGLRLFGLSLIENRETGEEAIMFVFNQDVEDFTSDDFFYIEREVEASKTLCSAIDKSKISFHKGKYPVVKDTISGYYYTVVNSTIVK